MSFTIPVCAKCGNRINPDQPGTYRLVEGWVEQRRGGGAHAIRDARLLGKFMHGHCMLGGATGAQAQELNLELI